MNIQIMLKIVLPIVTAPYCNYHCDGLNAIIVISDYLCYDRCCSLSLWCLVSIMIIAVTSIRIMTTDMIIMIKIHAFFLIISYNRSTINAGII
jgi:hypothetical protein